MALTGQLKDKSVVDKHVKYSIDFYIDGVFAYNKAYSANKLTDNLIKSKIKQEVMEYERVAEDESSIQTGVDVDISDNPTERDRFDLAYHNLKLYKEAQAAGITFTGINQTIKDLQDSINALSDAEKAEYLGII